MIDMTVDANGRLIEFQAIPQQELTAAPASAAPDWNVLFSAAELDPSQFQPAEPVRTWLATSDTRMAWTGTWPGSKWPLRIEAATLRGKPVAFALIGPWNKPDRMPPAESIDKGTMFALVLGVIFLAVLIVSVLLARRNLAAGRGDRRGAMRIAVFIFSVQMLLWLTRSYLAVSLGTLGMFLIAICTASFYGLVLWTVYLVLEPYVRRYWPHTIISWTRVLSGQIRDPIVGRDALFGLAAGVAGMLLDHTVNLWHQRNGMAVAMFPTDMLLGARRAFASWLLLSPTASGKPFSSSSSCFCCGRSFEPVARRRRFRAHLDRGGGDPERYVGAGGHRLGPLFRDNGDCCPPLGTSRPVCPDGRQRSVLPRADTARLGLVFRQRRPDAGWSAGLRGLGVLHVDAQPRIALAPLIT